MTNRTWLSGYAGDTTVSGRAAWAAAYSTPQVTTTYMDYESNWAQRATDIGYNAPNWINPVTDGSAVNVLTIGLILCAPGGSEAMNNTALAAAADGSDTAFIPGFTGLATKLKTLGMDSPSTVIRLGHEMNGNWYPWGTQTADAAAHAANAANYAAAFRKAVTAVRAVCPHIRFSICYNCGYYPVGDLAAHYPGDAYVDIISTDFYDDRVGGSSGTTITSSNLSFPAFMAFAHSHGKLFSLDEWGVNGNDSTPSTRDNAAFVQNIHTALQLMDTTYPGIVSHDSYFNMAPHFYLADNSRSAALYKTLWAGYTAPVKPAASHPTVGASARTFRTYLPPGTHTVDITAVNAQGESAPSKPVTFMVAAATEPGTMTGVKVTAVTSTSATLRWTGATGKFGAYNLFRNGHYMTTVDIPATGYTFTDLATQHRYTLSVSATLNYVDGPQTSNSVTTGS